MRTINVTISDDIEASHAVADFGKHCESLSIPGRQEIVQNVKDIAYDLERRGKELASIGSQFKTVKDIALPSCNVKIIATYGVPCNKSFIAWLWSLLRWR
jgi:hypothetical protein